MSFKNLGLPNTLVAALAEQQYKKAYPIQAKAIPPILKGKNVLGIAKTGSGKTASFVLPILTNLQGYSLTRNYLTLSKQWRFMVAFLSIHK